MIWRQFGFMPCEGATDAILMMRQMPKKCGNKVKKIYYAFIYLEKLLIPHKHYFTAFLPLLVI